MNFNVTLLHAWIWYHVIKWKYLLWVHRSTYTNHKKQVCKWVCTLYVRLQMYYDATCSYFYCCNGLSRYYRLAEAAPWSQQDKYDKNRNRRNYIRVGTMFSKLQTKSRLEVIFVRSNVILNENIAALYFRSKMTPVLKAFELPPLSY